MPKTDADGPADVVAFGPHKLPLGVEVVPVDTAAEIMKHRQGHAEPAGELPQLDVDVPAPCRIDHATEVRVIDDPFAVRTVRARMRRRRVWQFVGTNADRTQVQGV